jgi:putative tryptophan/tyrosine transport system substrate-binding protein
MRVARSQLSAFSKSIVGFALCGMLLVLCFPAQGQQAKKVPRIGVFLPASASASAQLLEAFRQGLYRHGYVVEQNLTLETRYAEGKVEGFAGLAAELVHLKVDVIVVGSTPGVMTVKNATGAIPIVMVTTGDPVASGLVSSLARPGGNITGLTALGQELGGKRLEVLKETVPKVSLVAVLSNPTNPDSSLSLKGVEAAARALGVQFRVHEVHDPTEFDKAFESITHEGARALMVLPDPMFVSQRGRIVALAAKSRLPAMYAHLEFVDAGGLMFYGASLADMWRSAATYVDKILKGAKPANLPVEQPKKFELVINLKAAKQIGLTIPPNVLARADKVIK